MVEFVDTKEKERVATRKEISRRVANEIGLTIDTVDYIVAAFLKQVGEELAGGKNVKLHSFGKFWLYTTPVKEGAGAFSKYGTVGGNVQVKWRPSKSLATLVKEDVLGK